jgi:Cytochrome c554 and c-prime
MIKKTVFIFLVFGLSSFNQAEENITLPESSKEIHMGVASCAASACHGKVAAVAERNVQLNEYHLWSTQDRHSRAYQTLLTDESKQIATRLHLPSAHTAQVCLACHADNIPAEKRGPKFQLSDGVGCEACHGGAEKWLKTHTELGATHKNNIANGLFPTENAYPRATLCLSCHAGAAHKDNKDKFADHEIMAAGHPRLTFELETFTANQPAHYTVDQDYKNRKGSPTLGYLWMAGQIQSAKNLLQLIDAHGQSIQERGINAKNLAIFDCHSCHRPMKVRAGDAPSASGTTPGSFRFLDAPLDMLAVVFANFMPEKESNWNQAVTRLQTNSMQAKDLATKTQDLMTQINQLETALINTPTSNEKIKALRRAIAEKGSQGAYSDFTSAEQAFLAIESLSYSLNDRDRLEAGLDAVYKSVDNEFSFNPASFRQALSNICKIL